MKRLLKSGLAKSCAAAAVAVSFSLSPLAAGAAERTLTVSSWAPPTQGVNAIFLPEMIRQIEAATQGRVSGEIKYGLGSPPAQYDLVLDGAADITWIFHGYTPGRFKATKLIELPGYTGSAEAASVAYWRAHEKFLARADEHKGVRLIGLMTHGPGMLHSNTKIESLDRISGMKLRLGGGVSGDVGAALGATGINVPAPKVYETLASNAADGVMMPMESKAGFKLYEVAKHTYSVPGGFYRGSFAIVMNPRTFAALSKADQAALDKVFGENLSRLAGQMWDTIDANGMKALQAAPDNSFTEASPADTAKWQALTGPIVQKVMAEVKSAGVDAEAARAFIAAQMAAY